LCLVPFEDSGEELITGATLVVPPADQPRTVRLGAEERTRLVRVVHGPGHGFVVDTPMARRGSR
jgi:hypothetical protein